MIWPTGATLNVHHAFEAAGFKLCATFMGQWAEFAGEQPERFQSRFCSQTDLRVRRDLQSGFIGPLGEEHLKPFELFQRERANRDSRGPFEFVAAKAVEAGSAQLSEKPDLSDPTEFPGYFNKAAEALGFTASKTKDTDIVGKPLSLPVRDGHMLLFGLGPARTRLSRGAIATTCLLVPPASSEVAIRVNIDSLLPGLGIYRVYNTWPEAALGAQALVQAHRCLADALKS